MKETTLKSPEHVRTFYSTGNYSIENKTVEMFTEIPKVILSDENGKTYSLAQVKRYDISTTNISCMLSIYAHGHPTNREKLASENMIWDKNQFPLDEVFSNFDFSNNKILVITVHDEDFEQWHKDVYRFFVQNHVSYDAKSEEYIFNLEELQEFINGSFKDVNPKEEPKTVAGGVLDPAG
ncbi:hypothetical protein [Winogradskyella sp.]|uniref:hypothetical protein n=1 Tax=Winogradskyella sp. TaxID=1883156 RepID=UPI003BAC1245